MEQTQNNIDNNSINQQEVNADISEFEKHEDKSGSGFILLFPLIITVYLFLGFTNIDTKKNNADKFVTGSEEDSSGGDMPKINFSALLAPEEFSKNLRDTVYTDQDLWLELRIDQQQLYVHYRNGRTVNYPVSTGNPHASKSVESRPGLYAIFLKEEVHLSSQFNNARMNYYMPYNMGIGFHGLPGTGYYGHLGVRPSSHGCIRMRNEDVRAIFGQCKVGTLVLSHKGSTTRVVAFAPKDFVNPVGYTKDDYLNMLAYNLGSIMEGKYFTHPPQRFILDGTVIPRSGINISSIDKIPEKQLLPFAIARVKMMPDRLDYDTRNIEVKDINSVSLAELFELSGNDSIPVGHTSVSVDEETVKKYAHNPVGILPYFPPNR